MAASFKRTGQAQQANLRMRSGEVAYPFIAANPVQNVSVA